MNDGELQAAYKTYRERLDFIGGLGINRRDLAEILQDLDVCIRGIKDDIMFGVTGMLNACQDLTIPLLHFRFSFTGAK